MRNSPLQSSGTISQRGLFSLVMLLFSVSGLSIAMLSGAKLVFDILDVGLENSLDGLAIKVIVIALAYFVGCKRRISARCPHPAAKAWR